MHWTRAVTKFVQTVHIFRGNPIQSDLFGQLRV
jgi:hypothetical protein